MGHRTSQDVSQGSLIHKGITYSCGFLCPRESFSHGDLRLHPRACVSAHGDRLASVGTCTTLSAKSVTE